MPAQRRAHDTNMLEALRLIAERLLRELAPGVVTLPLVGGGDITVNPTFVMAVQTLTASTARITVAGVGAVDIDLSQAEVVDDLRGVP